jgi:hypothetical protein
MHDRLVGRRLGDSYPNWSAICAYYSTVHALRLVWFVLYGSFPKSHAPLGEAMAGERSIVANWSHGELSPGSVRLSAEALKGAIREGLGDGELADRVEAVGRVFGNAVKLREDSNYESLVLAHQYRHGIPGAEPDGFVSVQREFGRVHTALSRAQDFVLDFAARVVTAAFVDERDWFCPRSVYPGQELFALLCWHVHWKIAFASQRWRGSPPEPSEWWEGLSGIEAHHAEQAPEYESPADRLADATDFEVFDMKRGIMTEFQNKVRRLEDAIATE